MPGKPQTLSKGQQEEVIKIFKQKILTWILIALTILTGIAGFSLWDIKNRLELKLEELVAKQFEEPTIQKVVNEAAENKAKDLLTQKITPEIEKFTKNLADQQLKIDKLVSDTRQNLIARSTAWGRATISNCFCMENEVKT